MYQDPTHEVGQKFNEHGTVIDPSDAILEVTTVDENDRATQLKVLSRRAFAGENGLADIALKNTGGRSAGMQNGDGEAIYVTYGKHPCSEDYYGISKT